MKQRSSAPAADLYVSPLFKKGRRFAETRCDRWFILSAKHGLVRPNQVIEPYEQTLNTMPVAARRAWAAGVQRQLQRVLQPGEVVVILGGQRYREGLTGWLAANGHEVEVPMAGLALGQQLQWLNSQVSSGVSPALQGFYDLLGRLERGVGGKRMLAECHGRMPWPSRGVYFFFEPGELRVDGTARVVRVGTHAVSRGSKSTLWGRLRTHRGTSSGSGNHRGSVFRLHVGAALLGAAEELPTWGVKPSASSEIRAKERPHEEAVSRHLGSMSVLWLAVPDEPGPGSYRAYIEQQAIALLNAADPPSPNWLGLRSAKPQIRACGLWNLDHVGGDCDPGFLERFEQYVHHTVDEHAAR